jgi:hypothetical protein
MKENGGNEGNNESVCRRKMKKKNGVAISKHEEIIIKT